MPASAPVEQIDVDAALAELQAGRPVLLRHRHGFAVIAAAGLATAPYLEFLEQIAGSAATLALPAGDPASDGAQAVGVPRTGSPALRAAAVQALLRSGSGGDPVDHDSASEGALDLMRLAGMPAGALVLELERDARAAERLDGLGLGFVCVSEVAARCGALAYPVERAVSVRMPTLHGDFDVIGYHAPLQGLEFIAVVRGPFEGAERVPVSVREGCLAGDALYGARCDCGTRMTAALEDLGRRSCGILIRLEPDGAGLGVDHPPPDPCSVALAVQVIRDLGPASVVLVDTDDELATMLVERGCPVG